MATSVRQPEWQQPIRSGAADSPPLKIYNSLTRTKTPFVPIDQKVVKWYACGPTVYDDAHLGHARNYVSTDIIRRIMRDYFKFNVQYVQNVTDVDDKIILRGRQKYLLDELKQGRLGEYSQNISDTRKSALRAYLAKNLPNIPENKAVATITKDSLPEDYASLIDEGSRGDGEVLSDKDAKTQMHIKTVLGASRAVIAIDSQAEATQEELNNLDDIVMPFLDEKLKSTIDASDHTIFTKLTQFYEKRYTEDMRALNVLDPDEITRVTEYGPQIVDFVKQIERNQFAYTVRDTDSPNESVYFDIRAFEAANNSYAHLEPWNRNDTDLLADGEGALSKDATGKRSPADFALWKASKPGEPSWPSPWGAGRPGWHIECSAMASDKLGKQFDIHSGGIDLAFPHHDNEIAQSEAYWNRGREHQHQWVNYFLHMGHLSIRGAKMSKSLKNFTTIREALDRGTWTPRGLRIVFLLGGWKDGIEITDDVVKEGSAWEDRVNNFFIKAKDVLGTATDEEAPPAGQALLAALKRARKETLDALCNSFDTPIVMRIISDLISEYNIAYNNRDPPPTPHTTGKIAEWVTFMVNTLGLNGTTKPDDPTIGWSGIDVPEEAKPILTNLSQKRDGLRRRAKSKTRGISKEDLAPVPYPERPLTEAQSQREAPFREVLETFNESLKELNNSQSLAKDVLQLSDRLRDVDLWERDVYLEDRDGNLPALIRPVTRELRASRQAKEKAAQEKQIEKEQREQNKKKEETSKADKGKQDHLTMFRTDEYSAWDADGIPTKDKDGEEITKSRRKKLTKDWERQKKLHEAYLAKAI